MNLSTFELLNIPIGITGVDSAKPNERKFVQLTASEVDKLRNEFNFGRNIEAGEAVFLRVMTGYKTNPNAKDSLVPYVEKNGKPLYKTQYAIVGKRRTQKYNLTKEKATMIVFEGELYKSDGYTSPSSGERTIYKDFTSIINNKIDELDKAAQEITKN